MFRVTYFHGVDKLSTKSATFKSWFQASNNLEAALNNGDITGGDIEEHVDNIGWVISNKEPTEYLVECNISGVGRYFQDVVEALDYAADNFRFKLDSCRNKVYDIGNDNKVIAIFEKSGWSWKLNG